MTTPTPIWQFGPDWDMRPLVCPEPNIEMPHERFGGVFQGLSGARTMDVTGHKQRFTFQFDYLDQADMSWLQALHLRAIRGPFRLLNPMRRNLLSPSGSLLKVVPGFATAGQGLSVSGGTLSFISDWPSAAPPLGYVAAKWVNNGTAYARIDSRHMFPVKPGQQVTASVYAKGVTSADDAWLILDWYDKNRDQISSVNGGLTVIGSSFTRMTFTATPPTGAYTARMALWTGETTPVYLAAAQAEYGATATEWEPGGAAPRVLLDALDVKSPRFPYVNTTLSLLEA